MAVDMAIPAVRTPDVCFEALPAAFSEGFGSAVHYVDDLPGYEGLRMAYLDQGPADGPVFLCLHGEPSWSFLYRKMAPVFLEAGGRVVAPDFFGFGRSDKPTDDATYTFDFHRGALVALLDRLALPPFTLVCQDWGGVLGLTLPADRPQAIARLLVMNTALATGDVPPTKGFEAWRAYVASQPDFDVGGLMRRAIPNLSDEDRAAYDAPFPDPSYKAGVRTFPAIVPTSPDMPGAAMAREALKFWRDVWDGPTFMAVGAQDPVLGPEAMAALRKVIRRCPEPWIIDEAGHFVQEHGASVARAALDAWS